MLSHIAARTDRIILSTSTTLITTNDPVKIAEDFAVLQHLADGRVDLMMGRGNTGPVYPWFGKDVRQINLCRGRYAHYGHGSQEQAVVGAGGHVFVRRNSQDAVRGYRPCFDNSPVYGGGPSMEQYMSQTSLTVGSPQEVIDKMLSFRDHFGDYQRQLFNLDMAGPPLKTVLEQLDLLGEEVLPVLRKEFDAVRPGGVPEAPTHASLLARRATQSEEAGK